MIGKRYLVKIDKIKGVARYHGCTVVAIK